MTLKPYLNYKKSELSTVGKIPSHWVEKRAKYFFSEVDDRSITGSEEMLSVSHIRGVTRRKQLNVSMFQAESNEGHKLCQAGDVVINTMWAWMAALGVSNESGLVSPAYGIYRPREQKIYHRYFLDQLLRVDAYRTEYIYRSTGIRSSRLRLYPDKFLCMYLLCPPYEEQEAIIRFLKSKMTKTNQFIQKKKQLISLIKQQKQAIINQAVTRGIDSSARLKSSGIESLKEIPEHWKIQRLRTLANVMASNVDKNIVDGELSVCLCNYVDVYKNELITAELNFMKGSASADEIRKFEVKAGDVIITKDSESWQDIAVPAYVPSDLTNVVCGYHLSILRPDFNQISGEYLFRLIQSDPVANQLRIAANGVTRFGLSQGAIKDTILPVPPLGEQIKIVDFVRKASSQIDLAIVAAEKEIRLIQEYRDRLISDVVTGKLDVREVKIEESLLEESVAHQTEVEETEEPLELVGVADEDD